MSNALCVGASLVAPFVNNDDEEKWRDVPAQTVRQRRATQTFACRENSHDAV